MDVVCATKIRSYQYHAHKQSHLRPLVHAHHDLEDAVAIRYSWHCGFKHPMRPRASDILIQLCIVAGPLCKRIMVEDPIQKQQSIQQLKDHG